jgi:hypothetical protein
VAMQVTAYNKLVDIINERGITPAQFIQNKDLQKSLQSALTDQTKIGVGQEKVGEKLKLDIKNLEGLIDSGTAGATKLANIPINKLRGYESDPTLAPFVLQANLVATEFERLMIGNGLSVAMLPVSAQENAQKLLNKDMSATEMRSLFPTMMKDLENTIASNRKIQDTLLSRMTGGSGGVTTGKTSALSDEELINKYK